MTKLRMGVVGAGLWGTNHARAFNTLPETELVAVCDIDAAAPRRCARPPARRSPSPTTRR